MIRFIKNKIELLGSVSVEFKHKKSNFYVYVRKGYERSLVSQLSAGNVLLYGDRPSKRQKIKHVSEQLAELAASKTNRFFHTKDRKRASFLKSSRNLHSFYRRSGLLQSYLRLLSDRGRSRRIYHRILSKNLKRMKKDKVSKNFKKKYSKKVVRKYPTRPLFHFPGLNTLYGVIKTLYLHRDYPSKARMRYDRLRKKYRVVFVYKFNLNDKYAKYIFYKYVYRKHAYKKKFNMLNIKKN